MRIKHSLEDMDGSLERIELHLERIATTLERLTNIATKVEKTLTAPIRYVTGIQKGAW